MWRLTSLLAAALLLTAGVAAAEGDGTDALRAENEKLQERVRRLEGELESIKARLDQNPTDAVEDADGVSAALAAYLTTLPATSVAAEEAQAKTVEFKFYGFIKLDTSYDQDSIDTGDLAKWVDAGDGRSDDQFTMTANSTRLGVTMSGPDLGWVAVSGKVEIDFFGGGEPNKAHPYMRHAYMKLAWVEDGWSLIAGQTWDVISPLIPTTLNYAVGWWSGNIGYRRPQIRVTKIVDLDEDTQASFAFAFARTIGPDAPFASIDSGADSGLPNLQARIGVKMPLLGENKTAFGVSGHWGTEEYDADSEGKNEDIDTWSLNFDLSLPINEWLAFKCECWTGENLDQFFGGIGQGVNLSTLEGIGASGGWLAASILPMDDWTVNIGAALDNVKSSDVESGARTRNRSVWVNAIWTPIPHVKTGLELGHWETEYKDAKTGRSYRIQLSFIYSF